MHVARSMWMLRRRLLMIPAQMCFDETPDTGCGNCGPDGFCNDPAGCGACDVCTPCAAVLAADPENAECALCVACLPCVGCLECDQCASCNECWGDDECTGVSGSRVDRGCSHASERHAFAGCQGTGWVCESVDALTGWVGRCVQTRGLGRYTPAMVLGDSSSTSIWKTLVAVSLCTPRFFRGGKGSAFGTTTVRITFGSPAAMLERRTFRTWSTVTLRAPLRLHLFLFRDAIPSATTTRTRTTSAKVCGLGPAHSELARVMRKESAAGCVRSCGRTDGRAAWVGGACRSCELCELRL